MCDFGSYDFVIGFIHASQMVEMETKLNQIKRQVNKEIVEYNFCHFEILTDVDSSICFQSLLDCSLFNY